MNRMKSVSDISDSSEYYYETSVLFGVGLSKGCFIFMVLFCSWDSYPGTSSRNKKTSHVKWNKLLGRRLWSAQSWVEGASYSIGGINKQRSISLFVSKDGRAKKNRSYTKLARYYIVGMDSKADKLRICVLRCKKQQWRSGLCVVFGKATPRWTTIS